MGNYRVISSDSHIVEPPDLWEGRLEPGFRDRAPVFRREEDGDWWYCDGARITGVTTGTQAGVRFDAPEKIIRKDRFENVRPGGYIPQEHVKDMDADGVYAGVLYPSTGLNLFMYVQDSELLTATLRAYNDWLAEFCEPYPNRLKGIAMINTDDVQVGVKELERCARLGLAGAMIPVYPMGGRTYNLPEYEPLWAAGQDLEMPLSLHTTTNRSNAGLVFDDEAVLTPASQINRDHWVRMSLADIITSGVFERYPRLVVGAVEEELSWAAHFLDRMDYVYTQNARRTNWPRFKEDTLPSDYFHRNVFISFQEDGLGVRLRDVIGVDNLQWGSDYPHIESTFPKSREILEEILADCTEEEKAKIAGANAAKLYHLG